MDGLKNLSGVVPRSYKVAAFSAPVQDLDDVKFIVRHLIVQKNLDNTRTNGIS